jgi:hypothetical protein
VACKYLSVSAFSFFPIIILDFSLRKPSYQNVSLLFLSLQSRVSSPMKVLPACIFSRSQNSLPFSKAVFQLREESVASLIQAVGFQKK